MALCVQEEFPPSTNNSAHDFNILCHRCPCHMLLDCAKRRFVRSVPCRVAVCLHAQMLLQYDDTLENPQCNFHHPQAASIDLLRRYFLPSLRFAFLATLVLIDSALLHQYNILLRRKIHRIGVGRSDVRLCKQAGHLAMRFVLAACYPPYSSPRHEVCPIVELAHHVLHAVREH
jgi:hypothetical protein